MPIWGSGSQVAWAEGESVQIDGPQGLYKSTLAQNLALARCGFSDYAAVLGMPVQAGRGRTLYLAMDRPRQIRRSLRRMVGEAWRDELDDRLVIWEGPPPGVFNDHPGLLVEMCRAAEADTVVVDSLKDAVRKISEDEAGAAWNIARQLALRAGIQVLEVNHVRKRSQGHKDKPTIDDIYGSTWLTAGAGSVFLLDGTPGEPIVKMWHVKTPMDDCGPLTITADPDTGVVSLWTSVDLLVLARRPDGLSARQAAEAIYDTDAPTANQKETARRRLIRLANDGHLAVLSDGDKTTNMPTLWRAS